MLLTLYQTAHRLYIVRRAAEGPDGEPCWRVLKLDRTSAELAASEDPTPYTQPQVQRLLATIHAGNQAHGGLQLVCEAHAIIGCVQFLEGPYLLLCTRRRHLGALCGHKVYGIDATALLPLLSPATHRALYGSTQASGAEVRYRKLLAGVQLTKDFFFSYTWPIHQAMQRTFDQAPDEWWQAADADAHGGDDEDEGCGLSGSASQAAFDSHRVWNEFLSRPLREALAGGACQRWCVPLAHGFFEQRPLALLGRSLTLTLIARRSRQFAGTRYLKRGVTDAGYAANDVEVEQVVEAGLDWKSRQPLLSSVVQVRGSIPLHWAQQPDSSMLKPEIVLQRFDPLYQATQRHFDQLREQYGEPVCVLDLVKRMERRPRESILGQEFAAAVRHLNARLPPGQQRVQYAAFDLSHIARTAKKQLLGDLQRLQEPVLAATGIFTSGGGRGGAAHTRSQHGVLRTNCIDSLDRTNLAQFTFGMVALGQQLHALGISESAWLDPASSLAHHLMDAYERMGHTLALQYGGSEAHATFFQRQRGQWEAGVLSRDLLTAVRRIYSNYVSDAEKQDALNVFTGFFRPAPGRPHVWELGSDSYLHTGPGRAPARTKSLGSRVGIFSGAPRQGAGGGAAAGPAEELASFPAPASPHREPAVRGLLHGRLGSPPAAQEETPALDESLSTASLVSLSSDGSFAPSLHAMVDSAAPQPHPHPPFGAAPAEGEEPEPITPRASAQPAAEAAAAAVADAAMATAVSSSSSTPPPALPRRAGPKRSPLLGGTRRAAKLESLDKILQRQPVAHVRLSASPPPAKSSALGWLSPSKSTAAAAAKRSTAAPSAAAAAAARATVAAAGVAAAGPCVAIPGTGLRRSNSDPSLFSSLSAAAPIAVEPPPFYPPRRVTFDSAAGAAGPAGGSSLLRQSTAPANALPLGSGASAGAYGGPGAAYGSSMSGQLFLLECSDQLIAPGVGLLLPASLRRGGPSYHSLAGLNLEGAAAAEARIKPGPPPPEAPLPPPPPRRLSFPSFARLRALGRRTPQDDLAVAGVGCSATEPAPGAGAAAPSLLGPRRGGGATNGGAPELLSMSAVVYGAEAVRRGVDSLGVAGPASASWWLTGADPLAAMAEEQVQLREQILRQREALATPLDPVEHHALLEQCAALMRPAWALRLGAFQGAQAAAAPPPRPPGRGGPAPATQPVPPHGLAF